MLNNIYHEEYEVHEDLLKIKSLYLRALRELGNCSCVALTTYIHVGVRGEI